METFSHIKQTEVLAMYVHLKSIWLKIVHAYMYIYAHTAHTHYS